MTQSYSIKNLLKSADRSTTAILLSVPFLLTIWVYFGKKVHLALFRPDLQSHVHYDFYGTLYEYLAAFVCMFVIPFLIVKFVMKTPMAELGYRLGDARFGGRLLLITVPVVLILIWIGSADPMLQAEYPQARSVMGNWRLFAVAEFVYLIYYLGWEFFFRGYMLFGLEKRFGALAAILIQTIPSAIVHIGKPFSESFGAIFAGVIFGWIALRTRSIVWPLILHAVIGIATDIFVTIRLM